MSATSKLTVNVANPANNLIFARVTAAERDAHFDANNPPTIGMVIFNDDDKVLEFWNGTEWKVALGERTGGGGGRTVYDFQSFSFEESSSANYLGPDTNYVVQRINGNDGWKSNSSYLSVNQGTWDWTVPSTGNFKIECWGAQGGRSNCYGPAGGQGAYATGVIRLTGGDQLKIIVGRMGQGNCYDCGGGGFTAITNENYQAIVVAGGGGGGSASGMNGPGPFHGHANETGGGTAWANGGGPNQGGNGAGGPPGGGGGITGNGGGPWGGQSFQSGAQGGGNQARGGFGGGGGGGGTNGAGGGGGYGGGASSRWSFYGAGGGSFVDPEATSIQKQASQKSGGGKIVITKQ